MEPEPLDEVTVLRLLELDADKFEVVSRSSDRGFGIATVVDRSTRKLATAEEFRWSEGRWRVGRVGAPGVAAAAGRDLARAGRPSVARVAGRQVPVRVSSEGWWDLVVVVDGEDNPEFELESSDLGLFDPE